MKSIARTLVSLATLLAPTLASAQGYVQNTSTSYSLGFISTSGGFFPGVCTGIGCVATTILYIINAILVPVLFAIAFLYFLYGVYRYFIYNADNESEREKGKQFVLWSIIGFVTILSVWGIVNIVMSTFGLTTGNAPASPTFNVSGVK